MGGENVDDPVDRLCGALGVEGGQHEVTGFGGREGGRDRLEVAQLADQDHVGVLPQHVLQGGGEGLGVLAHLALVDQRLLVRVDELDRVLDRHDVGPPRPVDDVDQAGQGGRLPRAGRTGHEDETPVEGGERRDRRR
jgi:hypothetical protein